MAVKRRIVVVGLGSIGKRHAILLEEYENISVEAVEPNTEAAMNVKKEIGDLYIHSSFDKALKTKPDIVLIATPHSLHARQTIKALNAGCHVFCEKPMSNSLNDAREMKEASDRSGKILNIGFHFHFHPCLQKLKCYIEQGLLGQIIHAHVRVGTYNTLACSKSRYQAEQEGALISDYAHQPDILYWLLKEKPSAVFAHGLQAGDFELTSNPNFIDIFCNYKTTLITTIHLNYAQVPERHTYEIVGDKGWAALDVSSGCLEIATCPDSVVRTEKFNIERDDLYRAEHRAFFDTVDSKRKPETSASEGLVSVAVCEAALKSWRTNQVVELK
jgi:predicted dehydrogenase